jgi:hypothetical protein
VEIFEHRKYWQQSKDKIEIFFEYELRAYKVSILETKKIQSHLRLVYNSNKLLFTTIPFSNRGQDSLQMIKSVKMSPSSASWQENNLNVVNTQELPLVAIDTIPLKGQ